MSPAATLMANITSTDETKESDDHDCVASQYQKGVKHLCENYGISKVPKKYVLPESDRPNNAVDQTLLLQLNVITPNLKLPIIDFSELQGSNRSQALKSLAHACQEYGFFQVCKIHKYTLYIYMYIHIN